MLFSSLTGLKWDSEERLRLLYWPPIITTFPSNNVEFIKVGSREIYEILLNIFYLARVLSGLLSLDKNSCASFKFMMQRNFEPGQGGGMGWEGEGNQKITIKKKKKWNKYVPAIQQFGFTYISLFYLFGICCTADVWGELRDKLNMTYALQAVPNRVKACKNTQGEEKWLTTKSSDAAKKEKEKRQ